MAEIHFTDFNKLDLSRLPTPCFVVDEVAVERNLKKLSKLEQLSGAKVLHALKAFSMWQLAPLTRQYVSGTCSSGLQEAQLAEEFYGGQVHVFSVAYKEKELEQLLQFASHIVFNSCSQLMRYKDLCFTALKNRPELRFGLRINPMHSEAEVAIYDPCAPGSRLGVNRKTLDSYMEVAEFRQAFSLISGIHFHTLCEQNFMPLQRTLSVVESDFFDILTDMEWINFGGGHHITREDYQFDELVKCIQSFSEAHHLKVFVEPGEAVAIGTGVLCGEVLDVAENNPLQVILDVSATCHMPDTLEMPYRADISGAGVMGEKRYGYRLGGPTCLAGDVIGDYSFDRALEVGDRLVFEDMAHYTMVKTTTFNGTQLPSLAIWNSETDALKVVKSFGYEEFKSRLS